VIIPFKSADAGSIAIPATVAGVAVSSWNAFLSLGASRKLGWILPTNNTSEDDQDHEQNSGRAVGDIEFAWHQTPFNYPLWILFSSGTTGAPKAIVHRVGGMLLQSKKELSICAGLNENDVFLYYTTT